MTASISKIYIDGIEYNIKATLDSLGYRANLFGSYEEFENNAADLQKMDCFVVKGGDLFLYKYNDNADKNLPIVEQYQEIAITSLVNNSVSNLATLFEEIKTAAGDFNNSLKTLAAGIVKIFPSLESCLANYEPDSSEVSDNTDSEGNNKLLGGTYVITLGRYEINDGGGATYYVLNDDTKSFSPDGIFTYSLEQNLKYLVLLQQNSYDFIQLGGKANDTTAASQNTAILQKLAVSQKNFTLRLGKGVYFFNSTLINGNNFTIEGAGSDGQLLNNGNPAGTVIAYVPKNENITDRYL